MVYEINFIIANKCNDVEVNFASMLLNLFSILRIAK